MVFVAKVVMHLDQVEKLKGNHANRGTTVVYSIVSRNGMTHRFPEHFKGAFGSLGNISVAFGLWRSEKSVQRRLRRFLNRKSRVIVLNIPPAKGRLGL
jgi:hypothetical protein